MTGDARFRLLATGYFSLLAATWPLWTPQTVFPQVPLISIAGQIPPALEWTLLAVLLMSLGSMLVVRNMLILRLSSLSVLVSTVGLVGIDQHRLQPWVWQFVLISAVLATSRSDVSLAAWRWLVIGIYAWSAWSKMDHDFCLYHGPFLLDGFCKAIGLATGAKLWPGAVRIGLAATIPVFELLVAIGLCWRRTRFSAVIGAAAMHVGLLLALGPFGHGHRSAVLIWNIFFLAQNWWLFCHNPDPTTAGAIREAAGSTWLDNAVQHFMSAMIFGRAKLLLSREVGPRIDSAARREPRPALPHKRGQTPATVAHLDIEHSGRGSDPFCEAKPPRPPVPNDPFLDHPPTSKAYASKRCRLGNTIAVGIVTSAMAWPLVEPLGLCDHWPAWAVYAAKPERVTALIGTDEVTKLPEYLTQYVAVQPTLGDFYSFRIDRWSLDAVFVPTYPQDRFQVGVALGLAREYRLNQIQILIESPANRWTGKRTVRHFIGLEAIDRLADSYRCNGQPRARHLRTVKTASSAVAD